jgi:hypothetical protein
MAVNGVALAAVAAGAVFVYAGAKGKSVLASVQAVISGKSPSTAAAANTITAAPAVTAGAAPPAAGASGGGTVAPSGGSVSGGSNAANQALGRLMAAAYGWSAGAEWTALNNIVMSESGWDDNAANPTSNARGIAQNINGWSASYQQGNASQQIAWLLSYIKGRYGDPINAWAFHLANGWY